MSTYLTILQFPPPLPAASLSRNTMRQYVHLRSPQLGKTAVEQASHPFLRTVRAIGRHDPCSIQLPQLLWSDHLLISEDVVVEQIRE